MPPSADEARSQLDRVLVSGAFVNAARLRRFLRFVVERGLAGEGDRLKEYVIGVEVFDRDPHYDPRLDSIVRVEAGRVRSKLEAYYSGPGRDDPLIIRLPKGSYSPVFERRTPAAPTLVPREEATQPAVTAVDEVPRRSSLRRRALHAGLVLAALAVAVLGAWRAGYLSTGTARPLTIAVLPFAPYATSESERVLATRLTEGVTAELVRGGSFAVVSSTAARRFAETADSSDAGFAADVFLEARLLLGADEALRVEARLVNGARNQKFWVETLLGDADNLDELARRVAAAATLAAPESRG